jgi:hypothetical protein
MKEAAGRYNEQCLLEPLCTLGEHSLVKTAAAVVHLLQHVSKQLSCEWVCCFAGRPKICVQLLGIAAAAVSSANCLHPSFQHSAGM